MGDPKGGKPTVRGAADPPPGSTPRAGGDSSAHKTPGARGESPAGEPPRAGRVVHDSRGNAVWDWVKETSRIAIESTSALLKRLETPDLKVEDEEDQQLRLESDREPGGGYDPYNQVTSNKRKPPDSK
jgi:hypothetical protein